MKNILEKLGSMFDWLGKNLSRIKTAGTIVLIVLFFLSIIKGGCQRSEIENMVERITGLNIQNDILNKDIIERDSLILAKEERINSLNDSLSASIKRENNLKLDYRRLERDYGALADSLIKIPTDTSYAFLNDVAYPYEGSGSYPFNGTQVKGIHLTYLEREALETMNVNLLETLKEKDFQLADLGSISETRQSELTLYKENQSDFREELANKDSIIELKDKEIKKERNRKTFWQVTGGAIILLLAALSVSGG